MNRSYYAIQKAEETADIYIFGDITPYTWYDGDTSANRIVREIKELDVNTIDVHIDSYGGAVSEGWAIYNALRAHPAKIRTHGDGFVASAALFPFLAGDERIASHLSAYFMHKVTISAQGYAEELRTAADEADLMTGIGVQAFVERAGMDTQTVLGLMEQETWLTPDEALEYGIATAVTADIAPKYMQTVKKKILQKITMKEEKTEKKEPGSIMQMLAGNFYAR